MTKKTYGEKRATRGADSYGSYDKGELIRAENVAGTTINKPLPAMERNGN